MSQALAVPISTSDVLEELVPLWGFVRRWVGYHAREDKDPSYHAREDKDPSYFSLHSIPLLLYHQKLQSMCY